MTGYWLQNKVRKDFITTHISSATVPHIKMCPSFPTPSTPKGFFWNYPLTGHVVDMAQTTRMTLAV
jgi:hypothetical protein